MQKQNTKQKRRRKRGRRSKNTLAPNGIDSLQSLLQHLKITEWDVLLIGDGSGSNWLREAAWGCLLIDRASGARKLFYGALSSGSVALAEVFPYLHALLWYTGIHGPWRSRQKLAGSDIQSHVHIITDSQVTATVGKNPKSRRCHRELWAALDSFAGKNLILQYHYLPRTVVAANLLVDAVAAVCRETLRDTPVMENVRARLKKLVPGLPDQFSIYDFNS